MAKVFIGVGHGGADGGAAANGFKEKDLNLSIAHGCREVLEKHGIKVLMSRTKDEYDPLTDEIKECNIFAPDIAVDIHNNAGVGDGAEAFYQTKGGTSKTLAENVMREIVNIGQNSRGTKTRLNANGKDYYGFIREVKAPAIIVECAFIDNKTDLAIIDTTAEQKAMGVAIAKGILNTLGIAYIDTKKPTTDNVPDAYAADAVKWAIDNGILKGNENGDYKLHSNITRQDVIVFLCRALKK